MRSVHAWTLEVKPEKIDLIVQVKTSIDWPLDADAPPPYVRMAKWLQMPRRARQQPIDFGGRPENWSPALAIDYRDWHEPDGQEITIIPRVRGDYFGDHNPRRTFFCCFGSQNTLFRSTEVAAATGWWWWWQCSHWEQVCSGKVGRDSKKDQNEYVNWRDLFFFERTLSHCGNEITHMMARIEAAKILIFIKLPAVGWNGTENVKYSRERVRDDDSPNQALLFTREGSTTTTTTTTTSHDCLQKNQALDFRTFLPPPPNKTIWSEYHRKQIGMHNIRISKFETHSARGGQSNPESERFRFDFDTLTIRNRLRM